MHGRHRRRSVCTEEAIAISRFSWSQALLALVLLTSPSWATVGANRLVDVQRNSRVGGMIVVPFRGRHAVKLGYFVGVRTEFGADFDQFLASYQVLFP